MNEKQSTTLVVPDADTIVGTTDAGEALRLAVESATSAALLRHTLGKDGAGTQSVSLAIAYAIGRMAEADTLPTGEELAGMFPKEAEYRVNKAGEQTLHVFSTYSKARVSQLTTAGRAFVRWGVKPDSPVGRALLNGEAPKEVTTLVRGDKRPTVKALNAAKTAGDRERQRKAEERKREREAEERQRKAEAGRKGNGTVTTDHAPPRPSSVNNAVEMLEVIAAYLAGARVTARNAERIGRIVAGIEENMTTRPTGKGKAEA